MKPFETNTFIGDGESVLAFSLKAFFDDRWCSEEMIAKSEKILEEATNRISSLIAKELNKISENN